MSRSAVTHCIKSLTKLDSAVNQSELKLTYVAIDS
jgi:hypothetical protein